MTFTNSETTVQPKGYTGPSFNVNYVYLIITGVFLVAALIVLMCINATKESKIRKEISLKAKGGGSTDMGQPNF